MHKNVFSNCFRFSLFLLLLATINTQNVNAQQQSSSDLIPRIRLGFENELGYHRQLLLAIIPGTTSGVDYGYDGALIENQTDDLYWMIGGERYIIQAIPNIEAVADVSLGMHVGSTQQVTFMIDALENIDTSAFTFNIKDNVTGQLIDLNQGSFSTTVVQGIHINRFSMVISQNALGVEDDLLSQNLSMYYDTENERLNINGNTEEIKTITIYNILGQAIKKEEYTQALSQYSIPVHGVNGIYIAHIETLKGKIDKKFIKS